MSVRQTFRSPNHVRTAWWTVLCFWIDSLTRGKLQPELCCAGCTQTCMHMLTWHRQPIIHSRPKASAMDTTVVPRAHLFISLYLLCPTDNADPPTSPQMRPFPPKQEAENIHAISHVLLSLFFPLSKESSQVSTNQTQGSSNSTNSSQSMSSEIFWTQLYHSSSNCLNQVHKVKVRPIKNELNSPNYFKVSWTPQTRLQSKSSSNEERALQQHLPGLPLH